MIKNYAAFILLMTCLLSTFIAIGNEETNMNTEENTALTRVETMTSAFHKKDIEGVLKSYEDGAAVMFEPGVRQSGTAALKQMFEGAFQINPKFDYPNGHEVYIANNIALHIAPWVMTGKTPDGTSIEQSGLSVAVLRKQADGKWLMVLDNPHGQQLLGK